MVVEQTSNAQREGVRVTIVDRQRFLRLNDAFIESNTPTDDLQLRLTTLIKTSIIKADESIERIVVIVPPTEQLEESAYAADEAVIDQLVAEELKTPGTFIVETKHIRTLLADATAAQPDVTHLRADRLVEAVPLRSDEAKRRLIPLDSTVPATAPARRFVTRPSAASWHVIAQRLFRAKRFAQACWFDELAHSIDPTDQHIRRSLAAAYAKATEHEREIEVTHDATGHTIVRADDAVGVAIIDRTATRYFRQIALVASLMHEFPSMGQLNGDGFSTYEVLTRNEFWPRDPDELQETLHHYDRYMSVARLQLFRLAAERFFLDPYGAVACASWGLSAEGRWQELSEFFEAYQHVEGIEQFVGPMATAGVHLADTRGPEAREFFDGLKRLRNPAITKTVEDVDPYTGAIGAAIQKEEAWDKRRKAESIEPVKPADRTVAILPPSETGAVTFERIDFGWGDNAIDAGKKTLLKAYKKLFLIDENGHSKSFFEPMMLNDYYDETVFDGRYAWATIHRIAGESGEPLLLVIDTVDGSSRLITAADGLLPVNAPGERSFSRTQIAAIDVGKVILVGSSEKSWVLTVAVDGVLKPKVDVIARMMSEVNDLDKDQWKDPLLNVEPDLPIALRPDDALDGPATQVLIMRDRSHGGYGHPLLLSLADRSLKVIESPVTTHDLHVFGGRLYGLRPYHLKGNAAGYKQMLFRFDVATDEWIKVSDSLVHTTTQDQLMTQIDGRTFIFRSRVYEADQVEGPYRELPGIIPGAQREYLFLTLLKTRRYGTIISVQNAGYLRMTPAPRPTTGPSTHPATQESR